MTGHQRVQGGGGVGDPAADADSWGLRYLTPERSLLCYGPQLGEPKRTDTDERCNSLNVYSMERSRGWLMWEASRVGVSVENRKAVEEQRAEG